MNECAKSRRTKQREVILEILRTGPKHPTAEQIHQDARKAMPHISLGTVYRNLEYLASAGEISKLGTGDGPRHFDDNTRPHYHLKCNRCGKITDIEMDQLDLDKVIEKLSGYHVVSHRLEILGVCPDCQD